MPSLRSVVFMLASLL